MPLQLAILGSGRGSNARAILQAIEAHRLDARVCCIVSNVPDAGILKLAQDYAIPHVCIASKGLSREQHESQLLAYLNQYHPDYIVLAGYMRILTPHFLSQFNTSAEFKVVNIHPSLLPAFPGVEGYRQAFEYGVQVAGVTVHFVSSQLDNGPIIAQQAFVRQADMSLEAFEAAGLQVEHQLYPQVLQWLAQNRVRLKAIPHSDRFVVEVKHHVVC